MWPDVLTVKQFFEPVLCDAIVGEMKAAEGSAATVYGRTTSGSIDTNVRSSARLRSVATGRPQWTRLPPPTVREIEVEITK